MALSLKDLNKFRPTPRRGEGDGDRPPPRRVKPWEDLPPEAEEHGPQTTMVSARADTAGDSAFQLALGAGHELSNHADATEVDAQSEENYGDPSAVSSPSSILASGTELETLLGEREVVVASTLAERGGGIAVQPTSRANPASSEHATFEAPSGTSERDQARVVSAASHVLACGAEIEARSGELEAVAADIVPEGADISAQSTLQASLGASEHGIVEAPSGASERDQACAVSAASSGLASGTEIEARSGELELVAADSIAEGAGDILVQPTLQASLGTSEQGIVEAPSGERDQACAVSAASSVPASGTEGEARSGELELVAADSVAEGAGDVTVQSTLQASLGSADHMTFDAPSGRVERDHARVVSSPSSIPTDNTVIEVAERGEDLAVRPTSRTSVGATKHSTPKALRGRAERKNTSEQIGITKQVASAVSKAAVRARREAARPSTVVPHQASKSAIDKTSSESHLDHGIVEIGDAASLGSPPPSDDLREAVEPAWPQHPQVASTISSIQDNGSNPALHDGQKQRQRRNKGPLPTSPQQMLALGHLIALQISTGIGHTPLVKRAELAKLIGLKDESAKKQIQRLVDSGYIVRKEARDGRGTGGTIYEVPRDVLRAYDALTRTQHGSERPGMSGFERDLAPGQGVASQPPISVNPQNPTLPVVDDRAKQLSERLQAAADRFGLTELGVGANDLLNVWRAGAFRTEEHLLSSLEHLAFYLRTEHAKGIKHPKAWVITQLKRGYYAPPVGFRSMEEIQQEAALKATQAKLERLRELERSKVEAEFELWLAELSDARWRELLQGTPWADRERVISMPVKSVLRPIFLKEKDRVQV